MKEFSYPDDIDPTAIVSELVTTKSNQIQHRILTEPHETLRKPPLFAKGGIHEGETPNYDHAISIPALSVTTFPRGTIIGKGIHLTHDDQPIMSRTPMLVAAVPNVQFLVNWTGGCSIEQLIEKKRQENLHRHHVAAPCVCVGFCHTAAYGHWLIDYLPVVYMVQKFTKGPVKWIVHHEMKPWMKDLLDLFSIGPDQWVLYDPETEYITTDSLIFVTFLRRPSLLLHPMINLMVDQILENSGIQLEKPDLKLFVSRARLKHTKRQLVNYEDVESLFREKGFIIVFPESLSPLEQIKLFSRAKIVAGETGSGMHNALFSQSTCDVLVLHSKAWPDFNQAAVTDVRGQRIGYVFGDSIEREPSKPHLDRFVVDLKIVEEAIDELLAGEQYHSVISGKPKVWSRLQTYVRARSRRSHSIW